MENIYRDVPGFDIGYEEFRDLIEKCGNMKFESIPKLFVFKRVNVDIEFVTKTDQEQK